MMKNFDLNIDKILENWEVFHAVRELLANAIDEQTLTGTAKPQIFRDEVGWWHIRDFGRGLRYQDLIFRTSTAVGHAAREFRDVDQKGFVFVAPPNNHFVAGRLHG